MAQPQEAFDIRGIDLEPAAVVARGPAGLDAHVALAVELLKQLRHSRRQVT